VFAHQLCQNYRDAYGLFIACGILFNHEFARRGIPFVTRKSHARGRTHQARPRQEAVHGQPRRQARLGFAGDYVEAMWLMLQQDKPRRLRDRTGESHSVRDVLDISFKTLGLDWNQYVELDPRYLRPTEVDHLRGDASKARAKLGWKAEMSFEELITTMVRADEADVRGALAVARLRCNADLARHAILQPGAVHPPDESRACCRSAATSSSTIR